MKAQVIIALLLISTAQSLPDLVKCVNDVRIVVQDIGKISANAVDVPAMLGLADHADHAVIDCGNAYRIISSPKCQSAIHNLISTAKASGHRIRASPRTAYGDALNVAQKAKVVDISCVQ